MPKREKNDLLPGTLDMLILKTLKTRGPMHGYGIAQYIQATTDDVLKVDEGSLYPALQRLLLNAWVDAEWGHSVNNRRARFYRLTPAGRKQLEREVSSFDRLMEAIARVIRPAEEG
jgi:PadR family transcriptional regulator PadR